MRGAWFLVVCLASAVLLMPAVAHADRPFAIRYTTNDLGSITFAANTLMTCPDSAPTCASARLGAQGGSLGNNNGYAMTYVDVDGPSNTHLRLVDGDAEPAGGRLRPVRRPLLGG